MDQKIQCHKDVNCPEMNLQVCAVPVKPPAGLFAETDKLLLKCLWKCKESRISKPL